MKMLKLKDISNYLPYELIFQDKGVGLFITQVKLLSAQRLIEKSRENSAVRPILRPMSDLTKEISHKGETFVPIVELAKLLDLAGYSGLYQTYQFISERSCVEIYLWGDLQYVLYANELQLERPSSKSYCSIPLGEFTAMFDKLSEWMFDYRGLIEAGLAISTDTLPENPYEK